MHPSSVIFSLSASRLGLIRICGLSASRLGLIRICGLSASKLGLIQAIGIEAVVIVPVLVETHVILTRCLFATPVEEALEIVASFQMSVKHLAALYTGCWGGGVKRVPPCVVFMHVCCCRFYVI